QHGRLKLKTTEEQAEAKQKEREKKMKIAVAARDACFEKRKSSVLDEEGLEMTKQLLGGNPDFATLWNFRREIFQHFEKEKSPEVLQALLEKELSFLEACLRVNPKSYGTWYHRGWVLDHMPSPDWARELELCSKLLQLDERNFHCWDYRRLVVSRSQVSCSEELDFTFKLISSNFSNYSSWHYRSTLLPRVHPDTCQQAGRVHEGVLLTEYELVRNAFFTDPNDQSAWFYYRWLLGRDTLTTGAEMADTRDTVSQPALGFLIAADREETVSCLYVSREGQRLVLSFSRPVNVVLKAGAETLPQTSSSSGRSESWCRDSATDQQLFRSDLSVEKSTVLQSELDSCTQLQEMEPENKCTGQGQYQGSDSGTGQGQYQGSDSGTGHDQYQGSDSGTEQGQYQGCDSGCLLTIILLMRALDPLGYEKDTLQYFKTLKAADPMRSAYFDDLRSKFVIENSILKMEYAETRVVDLSKKDVTALYHLDQLLLVTHMNLSSNWLQSLTAQLSMLQCLEVSAIQWLLVHYNLRLGFSLL
ncbi:UNVERIFIED_CONTAM: hypothetical protein FKN15_025712, partial [Acipenser sinensis]